MSESANENVQLNALNSPLLFGGLLGILLAVIQRFFAPFELMTLGVAFFVLGGVLIQFNDRSWVDVGLALAVVGVVSVVAFQALTLVFG